MHSLVELQLEFKLIIYLDLCPCPSIEARKVIKLLTKVSLTLLE